MSKTMLSILLFMAPLFSFSQEKGIRFEHELSWQQIKEKARAENKYIFIDCFTTWCGPCRYMSNSIFTLEEVGNYFNDRFINVKVQFDKTKIDNEEVKQWYGASDSLAKEYSVNAYPTFLFFDPAGEAVHKFVGMSPNGQDFIRKAANAQIPDSQYYTLIRQFQKGDRDADFLKRTSLLALKAYDRDKVSILSKAYIATQKDLYTKDNLETLKSLTSGSKDEGFTLFLKNTAKVNAVLGKGEAEKFVFNIIMQEEVYRQIFNERNNKPDWNELTTRLKKKYPSYTKKVVAMGRVVYFQYLNDWENYGSAIVNYMGSYGADASPEDMNKFALFILKNCKDMAYLSKALEWSKNSIKDNNVPAFIDTYANILYKMGRKDEALIYEQKVVDLIEDKEEKSHFLKTIHKMEKGEKTWDQ